MRELLTIGNLRAARTAERAARMGAIAPTRMMLGYLGDAAADAANAMNAALLAHGYRLADMPLYKAFHDAARVPGNAYPGPAMMSALAVAVGIDAIAPVPVYPWKDLGRGTGNYDGVNAPTWAEWSAGATFPAPAPPARKPTAAPSSPSGEPSWLLPALGIGAASLVAYLVARSLKPRRVGARPSPAHALLMF